MNFIKKSTNTLDYLRRIINNTIRTTLQILSIAKIYFVTMNLYGPSKTNGRK